MTVRVQSGATEPITHLMLDSAGAPVSGLSPTLTIRKAGDTQWWDGSALSGGATNLAMDEVDDVDAMGEYRYQWATSGADEGAYVVRVGAISGVASVPAMGEIHVGEWAEYLDVAVSSRATSGLVQSGLEKLYGGNTRTRLYFASASIVSGEAGATRNVTLGNPSHMEAEVKQDADADWSSPTFTYFVVFNYLSGAASGAVPRSAAIWAAQPTDGTFSTVPYESE